MTGKVFFSGHTLWITVADVLKCRKVARKSSVKDDGFRTPQVELLLGDSSWTTHIDNGIRFDKRNFSCKELSNLPHVQH